MEHDGRSAGSGATTGEPMWGDLILDANDHVKMTAEPIKRDC